MTNKAKVLVVLLAASCLAGCVNAFVRCPGTPPRITKMYMCSGEVIPASIVVMFPQIMSDSPRRNAFYPENVITVPVGCFVFADGLCELVLDTAFWPADYWLSAYRSSTPPERGGEDAR